MTENEFFKMLKEVNWDGAKLPSGLIVDGCLYLGNTTIKTLPNNLTVGGALYLENTKIETLPENLTVGGWLDLRNTQIKTLPENLAVGGGVYLRNTQIKTLPENLTVGGSLYLENTKIETLPENLTVGESLDLGNTQIKTLPDNLTLSGRIYPNSLDTSKVKRLKNGDVTDKYVYADRILTHIKTIKKIDGITLYISPYKTVVARKDDTFAHGESIREAIQELRFKMAERNIEEYRNLGLESVLPFEEAVMMYRVITGSCQYGVNRFLEENKIEERNYTVAEILSLTKGYYGHEKLVGFLKER